MDDLPERVVIDGAVFTRVDGDDDSLACWTSTIDVEGAGACAVSLVIEPAGAPDSAARELAGIVSTRFGEFADIAADYLGRQLRGPQSGLGPSEIAKLDAAEPPFDSPEAVIWGDGTWMLRFAESSLEMADPFGIGVLFEGTTPRGVEDLSDAEPVSDTL